MARMARRMIMPWQFGSLTAPGYASFDSPDANGLMPHMDFVTTYEDLSFRLWEPGREAFSTPGSYDSDGGTGNEIPAVTTIHGIKGHIDIAFGTQVKDLGRFWTSEGVPITVEGDFDEGSPNSMNPAFAWMTLTGQWGPGTFAEPLSISQAVGEGQWEGYANILRNQAPLLRIPMFFCMYRGTYKQIDEAAGWEIDSGPPDDADTLLAVDITNPSVLESSRIDWWDMEMYPVPKLYTQYNLILAEGNSYQEPTWSNSMTGGFHRYAFNLDANKTLGADQVLWLQMKTGVIRLQGVFRTEDGSVVLEDVLYQGHQFSAAIHASALTSRRLAL